MIALKILESYSAYGEHHIKMKSNGLIPLIGNALNHSKNDLVVSKAAFVLSNISLNSPNDEVFKQVIVFTTIYIILLMLL